MRASHTEQDRIVLGTVNPKQFVDSDTPNIDYFREYALPQLESLGRKYVSLRTWPSAKDTTSSFTQEDLKAQGLSEEDIKAKMDTWNRIDQRSVLIKKSDYEAMSIDKILTYCKKYVDYIPETFDVTELLYSNLEGGEILYSEFRVNGNGELTKQLSDTYSVRSQLSLLKDKDRKKSDKN